VKHHSHGRYGFTFGVISSDVPEKNFCLEKSLETRIATLDNKVPVLKCSDYMDKEYINKQMLKCDVLNDPLHKCRISIRDTKNGGAYSLYTPEF
jgi:hypothetical protein